MTLIHIFADYSLTTLFSLIILSFAAGFIDAVVGGGGLIQLPALLINFPKTSIPVIFGTNKIAALAGTSIAAVQYAKRIRFNYPLLLVMAFCAGVASFSGARIVSYINVNTLKPVILVILILIAVYTFFKKDLGKVSGKLLPHNKQLWMGALIATIVGFYDGFFGPGTGSFLVLGFVVVLGFEFVTASAYAKLVNCMTNLAALVVFIRQGNYMLGLAVLMAFCNIAGNMLGAGMALRKGNGFVRIIFLVVVIIMIVRYAYDVFVVR